MKVIPLTQIGRIMQPGKISRKNGNGKEFDPGLIH